MEILSGYRIFVGILCISAIVFNLIVLPFVVNRFKGLSTSFKIIMAVFAVANVCHNLLDFIALPRIHHQPNMSIFYAESLINHPQLAQIVLVTLLSIFSIQIYNEFLHFLYRYITLCRSHLAHHLTPIKVIFFLLITVPLLGSTQGFLVNLCMRPISDELISETYRGRNQTSDNLFGIMFIFRVVEDQEITLFWRDISIGVAFLTINVVFIAGLFICGVKIHFFLKKNVFSPQMKEIHSTVFRMLIFQAGIPFFILHLPAIILLFGPIFFYLPRWATDVLVEVVLSCPVLEPFVAIYFLSKKSKTKPEGDLRYQVDHRTTNQQSINNRTSSVCPSAS